MKRLDDWLESLAPLLLESPFEIGPQKFKGQLAIRAQAVLDVAEDAGPEVKEVVEDVVEYIAPATQRKSRSWDFYFPRPSGTPSFALTDEQKKVLEDALKSWKPLTDKQLEQLQGSMKKLTFRINPTLFDPPSSEPGEESPKEPTGLRRGGRSERWPARAMGEAHLPAIGYPRSTWTPRQ